jgi:hypothetical protein
VLSILEIKYWQNPRDGVTAIPDSPQNHVPETVAVHSGLTYGHR